MELIFCGGKNKKFYEIATGTGFLYGAQLPCVIYGPLYFADQNWRCPNRINYMKSLREHRPYMASVLDWEFPSQLDDVLDWAYEAANYVEIVLIIPKVQQSIIQLPHEINGKPIRLGYSVPTKYGGTELFLSEFIGWPVHLLGGSPGIQMQIAQYLDVKSVDGNMPMKMANRGLFWNRGKSKYSNSWISLCVADGKRWNGNAPCEAFRRSCINIMQAWKAAP